MDPPASLRPRAMACHKTGQGDQSRGQDPARAPTGSNDEKSCGIDLMVCDALYGLMTRAVTSFGCYVMTEL
jgi:hypothetical protein